MTTSPATPALRVTADALRRFMAAAYEAVGIPAADASTIAALMAEAELLGNDGQGVIRLPHYIKRIRGGAINRRPNIRIVRERAAMALIDGDNGMGQLVVSQAVDLAIRKAREAGVAWVGTRYSNHAGAAALYARKPLQHDMLGLYFAVGSANHLPPWGGMDMLLSTNPIAAAFPAGAEPPVVLDMATTVTSYGKVKALAKLGGTMPEGWMIDAEGKPLRDPTRSREGFLVPVGGYKGYGLALMAGLFAGTLNGAAMGRNVVDFNMDSSSVTNTGQAILVIDLAAFGDPVAFRDTVDALVRDLHASKRLPGVERIWLPGEQSHEKRERYIREGIPIPAAIAAELRALAQELSIAPLAA